jgi:hypothetical protein
VLQREYIIPLYYDNLYTKCLLYCYEKIFHNQFVVLSLNKMCVKFVKGKSVCFV